MKAFRAYVGAAFVVIIAVLGVVIVLGLVWLAMGTAGAALTSSLSYSRDIAKDGHPVTWQGFKSFVITREADSTFVVSGERLGGEAVSVSLLVIDDSLSGQLRSYEGVDRGDSLSPIGTTTCRTERSLGQATSCSVIEFTPGQTGRFELTFTPADWLGDPSYTVSVDDAHGGSMNIHEPEMSQKEV